MSLATNTVVMSIKVKNHSLEQRLHYTKLHSMWDIRNDNSAWILVRKTWFSEKKISKKISYNSCVTFKPASFLLYEIKQKQAKRK